MGRHTCLYYDSKENLLEFVVPYFKQGFRENELCVWVVPESLGIEGAKEFLSKEIKDLSTYIEKGQLELLCHKDTYLQSGVFNPDKLLELLAKKEKDTLKQGFSGLCGSGDASWLQDKDWGKWVVYEKGVDKLLSEKKITALCTFPVENFDVSKLLVLNLSHDVTIRRKDGKTDILVNELRNLR